MFHLHPGKEHACISEDVHDAEEWSRSLHWGQKLISPDAQVRVRSGWGWREWLFVCTPSSTPKANFDSIYVRQKHPRPKAQGLRGFRKEWHVGQEHPRPFFCTPTLYPGERRRASEKKEILGQPSKNCLSKRGTFTSSDRRSCNRLRRPPLRQIVPWVGYVKGTP